MNNIKKNYIVYFLMIISFYSCERTDNIKLGVYSVYKSPLYLEILKNNGYRISFVDYFLDMGIEQNISLGDYKITENNNLILTDKYNNYKIKLIKTIKGYYVYEGNYFLKGKTFNFNRNFYPYESDDLKVTYNYIKKSRKKLIFNYKRRKDNNIRLISGKYETQQDREILDIETMNKYSFFYYNIYNGVKIIFSRGNYKTNKNKIYFEDADLKQQFDAIIINKDSILINSMPGIFFPKIYTLSQ